MARPSDDDTLEPILPKHPPPVDDVAAAAAAAALAEAAAAAPGAVARPAWERWVLLGCAVVGALSLVVCALRLSSIAEDQRLQACQVRIFVDQRGGANGSDLQQRFAECVGADDGSSSSQD